MALIEDFDNLARNYLTPKRDSSPEYKKSVNNDDKSSISDNEDIIALSEDNLYFSTQLQSNISELYIPEIGLTVDMDSLPDDLEVMIIDEPSIIDHPLDGLLDGDIDQYDCVNDGDEDDMISSDACDINFDSDSNDSHP